MMGGYGLPDKTWLNFEPRNEKKIQVFFVDIFTSYFQLVLK